MNDSAAPTERADAAGSETFLRTYSRLIADLNAAGARYLLIDHPPEGVTERASALRGHDIAHAAKCMIIRVKMGKKRVRYVLAVVPGNTRVGLPVIQSLLGGTHAALADRVTAEELAGSASGTVLPFSYRSDLELIADPALLTAPRLYFNAARLDRSIALVTEDYVRIANPRIERIAALSEASRLPRLLHGRPMPGSGPRESVPSTCPGENF